ncbi:LysE/ArgO family amino acid transporter [Cohnella yongneupensis]|uniref:LysE/ArgO family amino acid transporter n=1 Tax=Cohnella yongneupensis TaxID=425006 RepID=A0ABW0QVI5_9BACL
MEPIFQGFILGLSIAAPVGPIGLLCIRRTLTNGITHGFVSGIGAASADALYGCVAAFGLTFATQFLIKQAEWLHFLGAIFLLYIAYRTFTSNVAKEEAHTRAGNGYRRAYGSTLLLTLTNPMSIISFLGLFAGMNIHQGTDSSVLLVVGVFFGSAAWWLLLSSIVGSLRRMISESAMRAVNYASAIILLAFGLHSLYEAFRVGL